MPLIWLAAVTLRQASGLPKNRPVAIRKVVAIQARTLSVGQARKVLRCRGEPYWVHAPLPPPADKARRQIVCCEDKLRETRPGYPRLPEDCTTFGGIGRVYPGIWR